MKLISAQSILDNEFDSQKIRFLDTKYGNEELLHALDLLEIAGPFYNTSPWELQDQEGIKRIMAASYAATPFGEMHPDLTNFLSDFLQKNKSMTLPQQSASPFRAALGYNLIQLLSRDLPSHADSQVFFSSSGTEAIESALKFAKAYRSNARYFISFKGAYHGKTYGSLSLTPNPEYQDAFRPLVPGAITAPYGDSEALSTIIRRLGAKNIVAIVVEPIQGEGGVIIPPRDFLPFVGRVCKEHGIVCIADEIQTGLGRTGHFFESANQGLDPDIITLAKPLGGGLSAVGATIVRKDIYKTMLGGLASKRHSNTFGGNALAMAIALRSLELIVEQNLPARSLEMGQKALFSLKNLQNKYPDLIEEVRGQGLLLALQFKMPIQMSLPRELSELSGEATSILALRHIHNFGVMANLSLSSKRTVRFTPALNIPEELLQKMLERTENFAKANPSSAHIILNTPANILTKLASFAIMPARDRVGHQLPE